MTELMQITKDEYEKLCARANYAEGALAGIAFRLRAIVREEAPNSRMTSKLNMAAEDAQVLSMAFAPKEEADA